MHGVQSLKKLLISRRKSVIEPVLRNPRRVAADRRVRFHAEEAVGGRIQLEGRVGVPAGERPGGVVADIAVVVVGAADDEVFGGGLRRVDVEDAWVVLAEVLET
jgi:hypothetical protein